MFNLSSIFTTAAQAMAKRFVASDSMYQQYKAFCSQLGMAEPSRAEFDQFVNMFNTTSPEDKMKQLQSITSDQISSIVSKVGIPGAPKM